MTFDLNRADCRDRLFAAKDDEGARRSVRSIRRHSAQQRRRRRAVCLRRRFTRSGVLVLLLVVLLLLLVVLLLLLLLLLLSCVFLLFAKKKPPNPNQNLCYRCLRVKDFNGVGASAGRLSSSVASCRRSSTTDKELLNFLFMFF